MLKRFRTSRGYGVHSPFAFRLITQVLRNHTNYYVFNRKYYCSRHIVRQSRHSAAFSRLLFRIAMFFRPKHIVFLSDVSQELKFVYRDILRSLGSHKEQTTLYILSLSMCGYEECCANLISLMDKDNYVLIIDFRHVEKKQVKEVKDILDKRRFGMTFVCSGYSLLHVAMKDLSCNDYKIKI